jgi:cell division protein ZapA
MAEARVVHIEVHGTTYPIRTSLDPEYVNQLATFVEARIKLAAESAPSSDAVGLAILAALNITDEYFRSKTAANSTSGNLAARAEALERIVDQALQMAE